VPQVQKGLTKVGQLDSGAGQVMRLRITRFHWRKRPLNLNVSVL
jgi:hypothetical protein